MSLISDGNPITTKPQPGSAARIRRSVVPDYASVRRHAARVRRRRLPVLSERRLERPRLRRAGGNRLSRDLPPRDTRDLGRVDPTRLPIERRPGLSRRPTRPRAVGCCDHAAVNERSATSRASHRPQPSRLDPLLLGTRDDHRHSRTERDQTCRIIPPKIPMRPSDVELEACG